MNIYKICILISSFSFFIYARHYFASSKMKMEFKRFNLEKFGIIVIALQFLGATGLMIGFKYPPLITVSSFGLSLLMLLGVVVRINLKDGFWASLPAAFYMLLNLYILIISINQ